MRWRGLAATIVAAWAAPAAAAPGGTCADAIPVGALPFMSSGTTCGAGNDFTNDTGNAAVCSDLPRGYGGEDVFYKVVLGPGNKLAFDLTMPAGATGDLALFLVRQPSCADPPMCAATSVDLIGVGVGPERIKLQSYAPGTYYLIVDSALPSGDPGQCGAYDLAVTGHLSEFCGNGIVEAGEVCDDGNNTDGDCCSADCKTIAPAGTTCRVTAGSCDVAEVCDGNSGNCPVDKFLGPDTVCRPASGTCDLAELCTGTGPACPDDRVASAGLLCRSLGGPCDQAEFCTGSSKSCPDDRVLAAGAICGAGTPCLQIARCDGSSFLCPPAKAVDCNDNNDCTRDVCDPVYSCRHIPMCLDAGTDAAADAQPDGPPDLASDLTPDVSVSPDAPVAPDAAAVPADSGPSDMAPKPLVGDASADAPVRPDAPADGLPSTPSPVPDGASPDAPGPREVGTSPDAAPAPALDLAAAADGAADVGGSTDVRNVIQNVAGSGGCSCRLNSASSREESFLWAVPVLALLLRTTRRRRRHV
jgi:cysteine-rich repeat protein